MEDIQQAAREEFRSRMSREFAPLFLRLAFHDACSRDVIRNIGGATGSVRFPEEHERPGNEGVSAAIPLNQATRESLTAKGIEVSYGDLIVLAGAVAVEVCEGPRIEVELGRVDQTGADDDGYLPDSNEPYEELKARFERMGLNARDLIALSGAHTLGRAHGKAFTRDLLTFNNSYFKRLIGEGKAADLGLLNSDRALIRTDEGRKIVAEYVVDQQKFFDDFAIAYRKLTRPVSP